MSLESTIVNYKKDEQLPEGIITNDNESGQVSFISKIIFQLKELLRLLRVVQYLKNLFIFAPLVFTVQKHDLALLVKCFYAFLGFSFYASIVYIINDYFDIENDRRHPRKKYRPLAQSTVSVKLAFVTSAILMVAGGSLLLSIGNKVLALAVVYVIINILYSIKLKSVALLDIFIIASGFIIRIVLGAETINTELPVWVVIQTFLLTLLLAIIKRREDYIIYANTGIKSRKSIDGYNLDLINMCMMIISAALIISYIMFTLSLGKIFDNKANNLYLTTIFVIFGLLRYLQITFLNSKRTDPTQVICKDKIIVFTILGWIVSYYILSGKI